MAQNSDVFFGPIPNTGPKCLVPDLPLKLADTLIIDRLRVRATVVASDRIFGKTLTWKTVVARLIVRCKSLRGFALISNDARTLGTLTLRILLIPGPPFPASAAK